MEDLQAGIIYKTGEQIYMIWDKKKERWIELNEYELFCYDNKLEPENKINRLLYDK